MEYVHLIIVGLMTASFSVIVMAAFLGIIADLANKSFRSGK